MKKIRSGIPIATFAFAIASAVISNASQTATSVYGFSYFTGQCMEGAGPLESGCSTSNSGTQCTVVLPTGEGASAFTTQVSGQSCLYALKRLN